MSGAAAAEPAESLKPEPSIETAEPAAHFIPPQPPARVSRAEPGWPACCATSVMFGVAGLVFALHRLAETVLKEIVRPDPSLAFREVSDMLPVPRKLDWNVPFMQALSALRDLRGAALIAVACALLIVLGALFVATVRGARRSLLAPTLAFAVCAAALSAYGQPSVSDTVLRYFRTLGTFNQDSFAQIAWPSVLFSTALWTGAGLMLYGLFGARRVRGPAAAAAAALFVGAAFCYRAIPMRTVAPERDWNPAILTTVPPRSPLGVPDGPDAADLLAKQAHMSVGSQPEQPDRTMLMFMGPRIVDEKIEGVTEDGLTASPASLKAATSFLEKRRYTSALSWIAIKHSFGVQADQFDITGEIETCVTDMERCPHLQQCGATVRNLLFTCAASPSNLALLEEWADERRFVCPTRESRRTMGQLFERFGQPQKALEWYARADMPGSFMARVRSEKPLFNSGHISGVLTLNGQPLAGARVGAVPRRMNGLPPDLEPEVHDAWKEVAAYFPQRGYPPLHPAPFSLRWISAAGTTDPAGRFAIDNLTEGEYILVAALPPSVQFEVGADPRVQIGNPPPPCTVGYRTPSRDLGTIAIRFKQ